MSDLRDDILNKFASLISLERTGSYNEPELEALWSLAIDIRKLVDEADISNEIPYDLWRYLGNIDFGSIMPGSRDWILDDAEKALSELKSQY